MNRAVSRRAALRGSVAASLGLLALPARAVGGKSPASADAVTSLSANDRRLVEIADAYEALDRRCDAHAAAHRHSHTPATDDEFEALTNGFGPLEEECAATPADSLVGVVAKARLCRSPTARGCAGFEHIESVIEDLWRLQAGGGLAHA